MSLIDAMAEDFVLVTKVKKPDGAGGYLSESYEESEPFKAALTLDSSMEARVAEKQGVSSVYTVTTSRAVVLNYHDIIKRASDSRYFRVTSDGADKYSPTVSNLDMRQVTAEKWEVEHD